MGNWTRSKFYAGEMHLMRRLRLANITYVKIAKMFRSNQSLVRSICLGKVVCAKDGILLLDKGEFNLGIREVRYGRH